MSTKRIAILPTPEDQRPAGYLAGVALVMMAGVFWSLAGLFVRAVEAADVWQILFYRSVAVVIGVLVFMALRNRAEVVRQFRQSGWTAVIGGASLSLAFSGFVFAMVYTTIANAVLILAATPFLTAILGLVILKEPVRRITWAMMGLAAVGVAIMVRSGVEAGAWLGNATALLAAFGIAGYAVALRAGASQKREMMPAVCVAGTIAGLVAATQVESFAISPRDLMLCLAMGWVQIVLGMILFIRGSDRVPAAEMALLSLTEVVLAPIWVWLVYGETARTATLIGGALVILAIAVRALTGLRKRPVWRSV